MSRKATITDDNMINLTAQIASTFPDQYQFALSFYTALMMAEIFDDSEEPETKVYRRSCDKYSVGDFDFYDYTGGTLENKHRVEYYKAGSFVDKQILPDKEEAFKYILAILGDYIF